MAGGNSRVYNVEYNINAVTSGSAAALVELTEKAKAMAVPLDSAATAAKSLATSLETFQKAANNLKAVEISITLNTKAAGEQLKAVERMAAESAARISKTMASAFAGSASVRNIQGVTKDIKGLKAQISSNTLNDQEKRAALGQVAKLKAEEKLIRDQISKMGGTVQNAVNTEKTVKDVAKKLTPTPTKAGILAEAVRKGNATGKGLGKTAEGLDKLRASVSNFNKIKDKAVSLTVTQTGVTEANEALRVLSKHLSSINKAKNVNIRVTTSTKGVSENLKKIQAKLQGMAIPLTVAAPASGSGGTVASKAAQDAAPGKQGVWQPSSYYSSQSQQTSAVAAYNSSAGTASEYKRNYSNAVQEQTLPPVQTPVLPATPPIIDQIQNTAKEDTKKDRITDKRRANARAVFEEGGLMDLKALNERIAEQKAIKKYPEQALSQYRTIQEQAEQRQSEINSAWGDRTREISDIHKKAEETRNNHAVRMAAANEKRKSSETERAWREQEKRQTQVQKNKTLAEKQLLDKEIAQRNAEIQKARNRAKVQETIRQNAAKTLLAQQKAMTSEQVRAYNAHSGTMADMRRSRSNYYGGQINAQAAAYRSERQAYYERIWGAASGGANETYIPLEGGKRNFTGKTAKPMSRLGHASSAMERIKAAAYPLTGNTSLGARTPMAVDMASGMGTMFAVGGAMSAISSAFREAMGYQHTMKSVQAILKNSDDRYSQDKFEEMQKNVRDVGIKTKFSALEVADAARFMAMAGFDIDKINKAIRPVADVALIGDTDLGTTADKLTNVMSTFQIPAEKMREMADVMTSTFTNSNTDMMMLAESAKYAGGTANLYGHLDKNNFSDFMSIIGILGNAGIQSSMAGTTTRMMYQNLMQPNKNQRAAMKKYGITARGSDKKVLPMVDIIKQIADKVKPDDLADAMGQMFRITAQPGASTLATHIEDLAKLMQKNRDAAQNPGLSQSIANEKQNTLSGLWAQVTSTFTEGVVKAFETREGGWAGELLKLRDELAKPETAEIIASLVDLVVDLMKGMKFIAQTYAWIYNFAPKLFKGFLIFQFVMTQVGAVLSSLIQIGNVLKAVVTVPWEIINAIKGRTPEQIAEYNAKKESRKAAIIAGGHGGLIKQKWTAKAASGVGKAFGVLGRGLSLLGSVAPIAALAITGLSMATSAVAENIQEQKDKIAALAKTSRDAMDGPSKGTTPTLGTLSAPTPISIPTPKIKKPKPLGIYASLIDALNAHNILRVSGVQKEWAKDKIGTTNANVKLLGLGDPYPHHHEAVHETTLPGKMAWAVAVQKMQAAAVSLPKIYEAQKKIQEINNQYFNKSITDETRKKLAQQVINSTVRTKGLIDPSTQTFDQIVNNPNILQYTSANEAVRKVLTAEAEMRNGTQSALGFVASLKGTVSVGSQTWSENVARVIEGQVMMVRDMQGHAQNIALHADKLRNLNVADLLSNIKKVGGAIFSALNTLSTVAGGLYGQLLDLGLVKNNTTKDWYNYIMNENGGAMKHIPVTKKDAELTYQLYYSGAHPFMHDGKAMGKEEYIDYVVNSKDSNAARERATIRSRQAWRTAQDQKAKYDKAKSTLSSITTGNGAAGGTATGTTGTGTTGTGGTPSQKEYASNYDRSAAKPTQVVINIGNLANFDRTAIAGNSDERAMIDAIEGKIAQAVMMLSEQALNGAKSVITQGVA